MCQAAIAKPLLAAGLSHNTNKMKTAVTIIQFVQTGMDNYKDVKETKVFDDNTTLLEIKQWIHTKSKAKIDVSEISLATADFSDVVS
mgnify:CR=1 FL=1